jgi:hypothetical protein
MKRGNHTFLQNRGRDSRWKKSSHAARATRDDETTPGVVLDRQPRRTFCHSQHMRSELNSSSSFPVAQSTADNAHPVLQMSWKMIWSPSMSVHSVRIRTHAEALHLEASLYLKLIVSREEVHLCTCSAVLRCDVFRRSLYYGWMMFSSMMCGDWGGIWDRFSTS